MAPTPCLGSKCKRRETWIVALQLFVDSRLNIEKNNLNQSQLLFDISTDTINVQ